MAQSDNREARTTILGACMFFVFAIFFLFVVVVILDD